MHDSNPSKQHIQFSLDLMIFSPLDLGPTDLWDLSASAVRRIQRFLGNRSENFLLIWQTDATWSHSNAR